MMVLVRSLMKRVADSDDPYGGLSNPYLFTSDLKRVKPAHPGRPSFPSADGIAAPRIRTSSTTPAKRTNALIPYQRVTPIDSERLAGHTGGLVFLQRSERREAGDGPLKRSVIVSLEHVNLELD